MYKSPKEVIKMPTATPQPTLAVKKGRGPDKKPRKKPLTNYFGGR